MSNKVHTPSLRHNSHPGAFLESYMDKHNLSIHELALRARLSDATINSLINTTGFVTKEIAIALSQATGVATNFWLRMQNTYDRGLPHHCPNCGYTLYQVEQVTNLKPVIYVSHGEEIDVDPENSTVEKIQFVHYKCTNCCTTWPTAEDLIKDIITEHETLQ